MSQHAITTTIKSVWPSGEEHTYTTIPLGFDESGELALKLGKITAGPLGDVFGSVMRHLSVADTVKLAEAKEAGELEELAAAAAESEDILDGVDAGAVLDRLVSGIIEAGGMELIAEILHNTIRNTEATGKRAAQKLRLKDKTARDQAYAGGNQGEAAKAVAWVLAVNYAPFLMGRSWSFGDAWSFLRTALNEARQDSAPIEK